MIDNAFVLYFARDFNAFHVVRADHALDSILDDFDYCRALVAWDISLVLGRRTGGRG